MASIDINKLIQESVTKHLVNSPAGDGKPIQEEGVVDKVKGAWNDLKSNAKMARDDPEGFKKKGEEQWNDLKDKMHGAAAGAKKGGAAMSKDDETLKSHQGVAGSGKHFAGEVKKAAGEKADQAKEALKGAADTVKSKAGEFASKASGAASSAKESLKGAGSAAAEHIKAHPGAVAGAAGAAGLVGAGLLAKRFLKKKKAA